MHKKILLIEDNEAARNLLEFILEDAGFQVQSAARSDHVIEMAEGERPDVILMDVMMQPFTGYEVCKTLKKREQTCTIPIVLVSAKGQKKEQQEGLAAGASAYVVKPFEAEDLIRTLESLLEKKQE